MEKTPLTLLNLCTPLQYNKSACQDPSLLKYEKLKNEEILLCYEVNPVQGCSIEPDRDYFLGKLLFIGQRLPESKVASTSSATIREEGARVLQFLPYIGYRRRCWRLASSLLQK